MNIQDLIAIGFLKPPTINLGALLCISLGSVISLKAWRYWFENGPSFLAVPGALVQIQS